MTTPKTIPGSAAKDEPQLDRSRWVNLYTTLFSALGVSLVLLAVYNLPANLPGLLIYIGLGVFVELLGVELFASTRGSRVSAAAIISIAGVMTFGTLPGALIGSACGLASSLAPLLSKVKPSAGRAPVLQRSLFNIGMLAVSIGLAGLVYTGLGGIVGDPQQVANALPLFAAVLVSEATNILILIGVIHLQSGLPLPEIWEQNFRWGIPLSVAGEILGSFVFATAYARFDLLGLAFFYIPVLAIGYSFRMYVNNMRVYVNRLEQANMEMDGLNAGLLETLGAVIDAFDLYTYGHSAQVAAYTAALADHMGLPESEKTKIVRAALVHDIGKIGIMDEILGKPGSLTESERHLVERHPIISADILRQMKGLQDLVPLVRHHHEHWDGRGYPAGLSGQEIPLGARLIALADAVDAMCSSRPYRPGRTIEQVRLEVQAHSGTQFDPRVVAAFLKLADEQKPGYFRDSAAAVDENVAANERTFPSQNLRYIKRSMLSKSKGG